MSKHGVNNPNFRHGMRGTKFYMVWADMKKRCSSPKCISYKNYGGRGITYDPEWNLFINFMKDMLPTYTEGLSLDRIDVNGNYSKENCQWIEWEDQSRNHRKREDNISGVTGVHRAESFNSRVGKAYPRWVATWCDIGGIIRSKAFSINKFGEDGAFNMACEYRANMLESLKQQGVYYGESHGV